MGSSSDRSLIGLGIAIAAAVLALDQLSKWFMVAYVMDPPKTIAVTSFFNLILTFNRGISFGMFSSTANAGPWLLSAVALAISAFFLVLLWRTKQTWEASAIGGVIGGALGNVVDRVRQGAVTDFLDFHAGGYHWPAFNLADAAITTSMAIIVVCSFASSRQPAEQKARSD